MLLNAKTNQQIALIAYKFNIFSLNSQLDATFFCIHLKDFIITYYVIMDNIIIFVATCYASNWHSRTR